MDFIQCTGKRLCLRRSAWIVAEKWHAWRTSREMLAWYQRVCGEEPQLTGRRLYGEVIVRRSALDVKAAAAVLQRARQSFCDWPCERKLRFRDVVRYVVIDEYLRSHPTTLGTQTDMGTVVARIIPIYL
jgi:hypothetical protein